LQDMQVDCKDKNTKDNHWREKEELSLEREEECKVSKEERKVREEECKVREEECKVREEEHQKEEHLYSQWECVGLNIQQLSAALGKEKKSY